jgi:plastocyanin
MKSIVIRSITIICLGALAAVLIACGGPAVAELPMTSLPAPTPSAPAEQLASPTSAPKPTDAPTLLPTAKPTPLASKPTALPTLQPEPEGSTVAIKLSAFSPAKLEVVVGTTVVWTNYDVVPHTVTGGAPPSFGDPFGSDFLRQGQSFSFTFDQEGEYPYYCGPHEQMLGVVKVVAH